MLTAKEKQELESRLRAEREKLEKELDSFTKEFAQTPGGHETYLPEQEEAIGDVEDQAQVTEEYQKKKALESVLEKRIAELDAALKIIATPQYGICQKCGKSIAKQRLQVNPAALTCLKCAE